MTTSLVRELGSNEAVSCARNGAGGKIERPVVSGNMTLDDEASALTCTGRRVGGDGESTSIGLEDSAAGPVSTPAGRFSGDILLVALDMSSGRFPFSSSETEAAPSVRAGELPSGPF